MRLRKLFENRDRKLFVAYLTAGDPTLEATEEFVSRLAKAGTDIIELGVPFSDPVADGPTNIKAAERALKNKVSLAHVIDSVGRLRQRGETVPLVLFTYFNPVFRYGLKRFAEETKQNGVDGVLVVDLPPEESTELTALLTEAGVGSIFLASPTTVPERLKVIDEASTAFVYYVSRTGVTGARAELSQSMEKELAQARAHIKNPICVGFGISTPEQAKEVSRHAEGVVVGSALVKLIEEGGKAAGEKVEALARQMVSAIREK